MILLFVGVKLFASLVSAGCDVDPIFHRLFNQTIEFQQIIN